MFGTESMLLGMGATLVVCAGLVVIIWKQNLDFRGVSDEQLAASAERGTTRPA